MLARKILSQFKVLWFLNVFGNKLLAILHLEIAKKFAAGSAEQLNSPLMSAESGVARSLHQSLFVQCSSVNVHHTPIMF